MEKKLQINLQERAITLVALVITIVILIILAVVTVNGIFGESGLIAQANRGKEETEIADAREKISVVLSSAIVEKHKNPEYNEEEFLDDYIYEVNPDIEVEGEEISLNGHTFELNRNVPELGEYIGETGNLPAKIRKVELTNKSETEVSVEVTTARAEGMKLRYSYKKVDEEEYTQAVEQEGNTYTFSGLEEKNRYNIKVELINGEEIVDTEEIEADLGEEKFSEIYKETTKYTDSEGNTAWIPGGFAVGTSEAINKISTGLVITDAIDDNNSSIGNEFVWIPTGTYKTASGEKTNNLSRRTFTNKGATEASGDTAVFYQSSHTIGGDGKPYYCGEGNENSCTISNGVNSIDKFKASAESIEKGGKGGFYIGRYEAGTETDRKSNSDSLTIPLVQAGKYAYNYITRDQAKEQSEKMYENNEFVTSELVSSYAWDTALNYIGQNNNYSIVTFTSSTAGIYGNIGGKSEVLTGKYKYNGKTSDKYCNIYDMLGNLSEWSTEYYSFSNSAGSWPAVCRGGTYGSLWIGADGRSRNALTDTYASISFRIQLYVK